jgi:hypothetical protein
VETEAVRRSIDKTRGYAWGEGDGRQRIRLGHYSGLAKLVGLDIRIEIVCCGKDRYAIQRAASDDKQRPAIYRSCWQCGDKIVYSEQISGEPA